MLSLLLFTAQAGAEAPIVVNPESASATAAETAAMADTVVKETMENPEIQSRFTGEVTAATETVPSESYAGVPLIVYTLSHRGKEMRFLKETIGEADESGRYPLYITLHGGGGGPEELNNEQWIEIWDLETRAASRELISWYWLEAEPSVNAGIIRASFDSASNTYTVTPDDAVNGDFAILFLAGMVDTGRPVTVITPEGEYTLQVNPSEGLLLESFLERMDPDMTCIGKIRYSELSRTP